MPDFRFLTVPIVLSALALIAVSAAAVILLNGRNPWHTRLRRKPLLTSNEAKFFRRLQRALRLHTGRFVKIHPL
jgi:hypothetical protein